MTKTWPADRAESWPLAKLVPNARNARTHSDEQITQLAASIEEWGWTIPVLVDEAGGIIAGHGRVVAAHRLGLEDVPIMVAAG
jgi:ParB-like chromosome segregation protein Spo0J